MSVSTAIGRVSESLWKLLDREMRLDPPAEVTVLAPDEVGGARRINLFLYKVRENATLKNLDWQVKLGDPTKLAPPPLSLNLFYLLTPYASNDAQTGNSAAHEILGEAMRVFYENPIVPDEFLAEGLGDAREQIKIMLNTVDVEELSRVWSTFTKPFRLSVLYEISVVQLDMLPESERAMAKRVRQLGTPGVNAAFSPPQVDTMEPTTGPPGTVITIRGKHLAGWKVYVMVMRRLIVNEQDLTGDNFSMTLPTDLLPGFHEVRIDISHLFRRTFLFEIAT